MSDSTTSKMITLKSSDGVVFVVPETVAKQSKTICHIIEDTSTAMSSITLHNVTSPILEMVIEYCRKHVDDDAADESKTETTKEDSNTMQACSMISDKELRNWDKQFLDVDQETLFSLILAANYLSIKGLLDATCKKVADMMKGKSPEEIRQTFNTKNDYTPEEEEKVRRDHQWAFD